MMTLDVEIQAPTINAEAFDEIAASPENIDKRLELVEGEIIELVANAKSSEVAMIIGAMILQFIWKTGIKGRVTGADGGYIVNGWRYIPDAAFTRAERLTDESAGGYLTVAPDLAVEVISDPDSKAEQTVLRRKLSHYRAVGTVVWVVAPDEKSVEVHDAHGVTILTGDAPLTGGDLLAGFSVKVSDIFA